MLNPVLATHLGTRCTGYKVTTTSTPSISVDVGDDDLSSSTRNGAGKSTLVQKVPYSRAPIVIATPGADVALGGFATYDTTATKSDSVAEFLGVAGSGDDGSGYVLSVGWDFEQDDHVSKSNLQDVVNTNGYEPVVLCMRIAADASVTIGTKLASVAKDTSVYTITLEHAFAREPLVFATPIASAAAKGVKINSASATSVVVATSDVTGAAEDNAFDLVILGWMHKDALWGRRSLLQTPRRKPYLIPFHINGTGTAAVTIGSDDITLTDNGTGDYTLAWKTASKFTQAPIVIPTGKITRTQLHSAATATSARVLCFNAGGTATDDEFYGLAIGFDNADEFPLFG